ncbi:hypothetical protein RRG08_058835 [Elysia crispata]|uniref:Uncharacterized protein n=1 Tax=Elysia crispata TaxID=231223 RepID=A0AAE0XZQ3_9GAST|nr:hypothetical protein RRG08_058835 [Elysia crispata]
MSKSSTVTLWRPFTRRTMRRSFLCHLLMIIVWTGIVRTNDCPLGWFIHEPSVSCLQLITTSLTWTNARQKCQELGGDLVKINDAEMNTFIKNKLTIDTQNWWIGLKKYGSNYRWLNETTNAVYENFELTVYPVNEVRNCIVYEKSSETWHREFCGVSKPSICQNSNNVIYCEEFLELNELWPVCEKNMKTNHRFKACIEDRTVNVLRYYNKQVLCDTETDGGGWILFHRRSNMNVSFDRDWNEYKNGFGSFDGDFWLGLELVHRLTSQCEWELRIDMLYSGQQYHVVYSSFKLEDEAQHYKIRLGPMEVDESTPGIRDEFLNPVNPSNMINNRRFSTRDVDNDSNDPRASYNCSTYYGPWWHNFCASGFFNFQQFLAWRSVNLIGNVAWGNMASSELKIRHKPK